MAEVRFLGCDNDVFCASVQAGAIGGYAAR